MEREYRVTVKSPYGKQPLQQFRHWLSKVADDADTRWGIDITIETVTEDQE